MSYHTIIYSSSVSNSGNQQVSAISDGEFRVSNSSFFIPIDLRLYAASANSANITAARLTSPSILAIAPHHIKPVDQSATPSSLPQVADHTNLPVSIRAFEELRAEVSQGGAYNETANVVCHLGTSIDPLPSGTPFLIRGTSSTTLVASAFSDLTTITWEQTVPTGEYAVVRLLVLSTTGIAARLKFDNQRFRPGSVCLNAAGDNEHPLFQHRRLGTLGRFRNTTYPIVSVFATSADTSQTVFLEVVKVG